MRYLVDAKGVSHDRLQDEVIVINVASGAYYSGSGCAADVWTLLTQGASLDEAARHLATAYDEAEETIRRDVATCADFLVERGLLQASDAPAPKTEFDLPGGARTVWRAPEFDEYTDMWELIKLDPIHEVEEVGWPVRKV
ncbi:PqqD family protein [Rhodoplanes sp. Z2-YC6860]|uniref:PqqD family protein n=1 Tax=Rhodoplanes sp. Z2-YC6860 TaxID=674703 RepID=UPI00078E5EC6|nr:PqqD family protein [Rhodoplanes sp. Z2-YC6860]AMN39830.1 hypothetical protein RHPLAN_13750 [Rhodoplanes sp. Z2-YC6860]